MGDSFAVGLRAVAGAWVDHRSGQTRMPPQERRHEGVFGLGDSFAVGLGAVAGCGRLTTGVVRHACRLRRDGTRRFLVWGDYFAVGLGAVAGASV